MPSEVPFFLPVLHSRLRELVISSGGSPFGHPRGRNLGHDLGNRVSRRLETASEGEVSDRAEPHDSFRHHLPRPAGVVRALAVEHSVALEYSTLMSKIDWRYIQLFAVDVVPDVQFSPITQGKYPHMLTLVYSTVVQAPELGTLVLRIPLPEFIAV